MQIPLFTPTNRIVLHLIDSHFCTLPMNKLYKAASLARWNLNISNLTKPSKVAAGQDVTAQVSVKNIIKRTREIFG